MTLETTRVETDHEAKRDELYFVPTNPTITSTDGIRKSVRVKEVSASGDFRKAKFYKVEREDVFKSG